MSDDLEPEELRAIRRKARAAIVDALAAVGGEGGRGEILERARAHGGFSERELAPPAPPAKRDKYDCQVAYELSWALTNLKRDGRVTKPRWSVWALAGHDAPPQAPLAAPVLTSRLDELRAMPYREYLRTPEWKETRIAALVRSGQACAMDIAHTDRLEVHHRTHDNLGAERPEDLLVMCRDCHALHHRANGRPRRKPAAESFPPPAPSPRPSRLRRLLGSRR